MNNISKRSKKRQFENTLVCLSGAQMGLNREKNWGRKSRDTLPLNEGRTKLEGRNLF